MLHFPFEELPFVQDFERHHKLALFLSSKVHVAKLATAKRPADLKVVDSPLGAVKVLIASIWKVARLFACGDLFKSSQKVKIQA